MAQMNLETIIKQNLEGDDLIIADLRAKALFFEDAQFKGNPFILRVFIGIIDALREKIEGRFDGETPHADSWGNGVTEDNKFITILRDQTSLPDNTQIILSSNQMNIIFDIIDSLREVTPE